MTILTRQSVLLAKIEGTPGTDATPTGTDGAFNAFNINIEPLMTMAEREGQGGAGRLTATTEDFLARVTFQTDVQWDGSATEPTWADTFFPGCAYVKSSQTYYPVLEAPGSNAKTLTFYHYVGPTGSNASILRKVVGAAGTFSVAYVASKRIVFSWDFLGIWAGESAGTMPSPTYPTDAPYKWANGASTWNSVAWQSRTATVNANNTLQAIADGGQDNGYKFVMVTDRYPKINIAPLKVAVATQARQSAWETGSEYALALHAGGVGTSLFQCDAPKAQIMKTTHADQEGLVVEQAELACNKNGSTHNQELSFTFTATS